MRSRKAGSPPSPAALGVVKVGDDFTEEFPDGDPRLTEVHASLVRTGSALIREIERCMQATFDAPQTALNSLAVIDGAGEPLTPSQISERTHVSSATMTGTIDQLEYRGWVRRLPNPDDRRSVLVEITEAGKVVTDQLLPGIRKIERAVLGGLTADELGTLLALLAKVLAGAAATAAAEPITLEGRRHRPPHLR
jgi:DNA-binding MarR family transcriptional regulator